jgi:uncharacterized protein YxeA
MNLAVILVLIAVILVVLAVGYIGLAWYFSFWPFKKNTKEEAKKNVKFERADNMNYAYNKVGVEGYSSVLKDSRDECEEVCKQDKDCLAYTYVEAAKRCFIVKTPNYTKKPEKGHLSGYKTTS